MGGGRRRVRLEGVWGPRGGGGRITEPWNHRLVLVGKDLKDHFIPSPWRGQGCHPQVVQIILSAHHKDPHLDTGTILLPPVPQRHLQTGASPVWEEGEQPRVFISREQ